MVVLRRRVQRRLRFGNSDLLGLRRFLYRLSLLGSFLHLHSRLRLSRLLDRDIGNNFYIIITGEYALCGFSGFTVSRSPAFGKNQIVVAFGLDILFLLFRHRLGLGKSVDDLKLILGDGIEHHLRDEGARIQREHQELRGSESGYISCALLDSREEGIEAVGQHQRNGGQAVDKAALDRISALDPRHDHRVREIVERDENIAE